MRECEIKKQLEEHCFYEKEGYCLLPSRACVRKHDSFLGESRMKKMIQFFTVDKDFQSLEELIAGDISPSLRVLALGSLDTIKKSSDGYYGFLEYLTVSDVDDGVKGMALDILFERFPKKATKVIKFLWDNHVNMTDVGRALAYFVNLLHGRDSLKFLDDFIDENVKVENGNLEIMKYYIRNKEILFQRPFKFTYEIYMNYIIGTYQINPISSTKTYDYLFIHFYDIERLGRLKLSKPFNNKQINKMELMNDGEWYFILSSRHRERHYFYSGFPVNIYDFFRSFLKEELFIFYLESKKELIITSKEIPKLCIGIELHNFDRYEEETFPCNDRIRIIKMEHLNREEKYRKKFKLEDFFNCQVVKPNRDENIYWCIIFERNLKSGNHIHYIDLELLLFVLKQIMLRSQGRAEFNLKGTLDYLIVFEKGLEFFYKIKISEQAISDSLKAFCKEFNKRIVNLGDYLMGVREEKRLYCWEEGYTTRRDLQIEDNEVVELELVNKYYDKITEQIIQLYNEYYRDIKDDKGILECVIDEVICDNYLEKDLFNNKTAWLIREKLMRDKDNIYYRIKPGLEEC